MAQQDWKILKEEALGYHKSASVLLDQGLAKNALEQSHFSVEIVMKAAIAKAGVDKYPGSSKKGHDLVEIARCKIDQRKSLHQAVQADKGIRPTFNEVLSGAAWQMHHRYSKHPLDEASMRQLVEKYGRIYKWIEKNYL